MQFRSIDEWALEGKRVFVRVDFNVPLDAKGRIADDTRIRSALPTLKYAVEQKARLIVASHLGRPKGKPEPQWSMKPCADLLSRLLGRKVRMAPDCVGAEVERLADGMRPGDVLMLENLRFHKGEADNDPEFAKRLARLADVYINDGFAVAHRANASVEAITRFCDACGAGFLMRSELQAFAQAMENPARPLVAILGGGKVADKLGAVFHLLDLADKVILGGAVAYTFLQAQGVDPGASLVEEGLIPEAKRILAKARRKGVKFYLPVDCVVAQEKSPGAVALVRPVQEIPKGWMALDIGPATVALFSAAIGDARTVIWNGPMGVYELDPFSRGTSALIRAVAGSHAFTMLGGGDLDSAVHRAGEARRISYISTGGGAFVELIEGKMLPGVQALIRCGRKGRQP
jgi:phosphoglycerate kinase